MTEENEECCIELGRLIVCVVTAEDMGRKSIFVKHNGESKWFENVEDSEKYLNKRGVAKNKIKRVLAFVNTQFRSLKKLDKDTSVEGKGFGLEVGVGKGEDKEV